MSSLRVAGCSASAWACVVLAGCGAASSNQVVQRPAQRVRTAPVSVGARGDVHLTDYTANDNARSHVIVTGIVGDFGMAERNDSTDQLDVRLSHGTFQLNLAALDRRFLARVRDITVNRRSCSSQATASASAPITPGSGTGSYATISGTFQLTITLDEVYRPGACREGAPYLAQAVVTTGWGHVSID